MAPTNIISILRLCAGRNDGHGIVTYPLGSRNSVKTLYKDLEFQVIHNARLLSHIPNFRPRSIVLLHFTDHLDNIVWFWSVIAAGGIPALSTPFSNVETQRLKHIAHLYNLLKAPLCITRSSLLDQFSDQDVLRPYVIEDISSAQVTSQKDTIDELGRVAREEHPEDLALLMLTSGSTGNAKAVCLTHGQIFASMAGKSSVRKGIPKEFSALNWIGFDHVANLTEIHLEAMYLGIDQIHVQAPDVISNPLLFLELIHKHRVGWTFAPNFFLGKLRKQIDTAIMDTNLDLDLSCLRFLVSGGEANVVETCDVLARYLGKYGAPPNVISAAFGMTETCAGSIYNLDCPRYDVQNMQQFCSLGRCVPGIEMRVTVPQAGDESVQASANELGLLEVRGPIVFKCYFNNKSATTASFTPDGWFRTGDHATIDRAGMLHLVGRTNDTMNINGVKHLPSELEAAIEEFEIEGVTPSYTVSFSFRPLGAESEQIEVVYLPSFGPQDVDARIAARDAIIQVTMLQTGSRPSVLPLNDTLLQKTTLGKLSRAKIRAAFERGDYKKCLEFDKMQIEIYNLSHMQQPCTQSERIIQEVFCEDLDLRPQELGVNTHVFEIGITSIHLIRLKQKLQSRFSIPEIPVRIMMQNSTVRELATALENLGKPRNYEPIIALQNNARKAPLWLFHPGVGEVLVFLNLAKYLPDRSVFALRARGFEKGETFFTDIKEAVNTYFEAIKSKQPQGPYLLAGYSYGTMLAFETAKLLEASGDEISFLGSFNLPPHIKSRMRQLDWTECLLHLAYFLSLINVKDCEIMAPQLRQYSKKQAIQYISEVANSNRLLELSLNEEMLGNWVDLSYRLQSMASNYDPSGTVAMIDIFVAEPLQAVAANKEDWRKNSLSKWADFSRSKPRFHDVKGEHYTMIGADHVFSFQQTFRKALEARGC
ncbi:hypothetical protein BCON_0304g00010 [Botryotinia convoluta]|uniref:Carrier domain-containing protein n=1 Tax=Botryotinia convoluta TaxID=54673 RepID=A0A4Z1HI11_9HELO|nr:hypothetical protein BCON_0304g00010 [Botryotinia convoluta]